MPSYLACCWQEERASAGQASDELLVVLWRSLLRSPEQLGPAAHVHTSTLQQQPYPPHRQGIACTRSLIARYATHIYLYPTYRSLGDQPHSPPPT
jgi:hypothetical protein